MQIDTHNGTDVLDTLITRWVMTKYRKSNSVRTRDTYLESIQRVRTYLHEQGADLDSPTDILVPLLEIWIGAAHKAGMSVVSPNTRNLRQSTLSSFYTYGMRQRVFASNPIAFIERAAPAPPQKARVLDQRTVESRLRGIDRSTPLGVRDLALILIAIMTGRRAAELSGMRMGHLTPTATGVLIRWPRLKGGKTDETLLEYPIAQTLVLHLISQEGAHWPQADPSAAVWRVQSAHGLGDPLGYKGIQEVFRKRLGVTTVHSTRHTFATALKQMGVPITDIQRLLQHSSLAVTQRYLAVELPTPVNPYAQQLGDHFDLTRVLDLATPPDEEASAEPVRPSQDS